jgi:3-methyladenine DNA glycosylase AlkD
LPGDNLRKNIGPAALAQPFKHPAAPRRIMRNFRDSDTMSDDRAVHVQEALARLANPADAAFLQRYFKTGPGDYAEGDRFLGIRVPALRALARTRRGLPLGELRALLNSPWHEARLLALLVLVHQYERASADQRALIHQTYLTERAHVNNWDLVDLSAPTLVGRHLFELSGPDREQKARSVLAELAGSASLWDRRIAMLATQYFIRQGQFDLTLYVAEILLHDEHDLIHKAVGWMLREVGKRDRAREEAFLRRHYREMPRTMLRYAVEKLPDRLSFLGL